MNANEGYKLYVTGHSLGAALASLFAFCASKSEQIAKPVTCVSVASPYVGDESWRQAVIESEKAGFFRYLRLVNASDVIPHGPPFDMSLRLYKHVGVSLRLENDGWSGSEPFGTFQYPKGFAAEVKHAHTNSFLSNFGWTPSRVLKMHSCKEYARRLHKSRNELETLYLNDKYEEYFREETKRNVRMISAQETFKSIQGLIQGLIQDLIQASKKYQKLFIKGNAKN